MTAPSVLARAQPGPQSRFLSSLADIAVYGGAAGGGKSFALLLEPLYNYNHPGLGAAIFRRTSPQLTGAGSLWADAQWLYRPLGATLRESPTLDVRFKAGGQLQFLHLQHESDVYDHQGKSYSLVGLDELTHFSEFQFWYLVSRLRSPHGLKPLLRATTNPDPDSFVRVLIDWWIGSDGYPIHERSGVLRWFVRDGNTLLWADNPEAFAGRPQRPMSFTFIAAKLSDNPALTSKDPDYAARLASLPEVERLRLAGGNWDVRADGGKYLEAGWFANRWAEEPSNLNVYICSDYAVSEPRPGADPDWTEHGVFGIAPDDSIYVLDWWSGQTKADVWIEALIDKVARWKPHAVFGEAGVIQKSIEPALAKRLRERKVYTRLEWLSSSTRSDSAIYRVGFADPSKRAKAVRGRSLQARAAMGKFVFPANAPWVDRVVNQLVGFPVGHDDAFDVCAHMAQAIDDVHPALVPTAASKPRERAYRPRETPGEDWKLA